MEEVGTRWKKSELDGRNIVTYAVVPRPICELRMRRITCKFANLRMHCTTHYQRMHCTTSICELHTSFGYERRGGKNAFSSFVGCTKIVHGFCYWSVKI
jgi:hypothetical protein